MLKQRFQARTVFSSGIFKQPHEQTINQYDTSAMLKADDDNPRLNFRVTPHGQLINAFDPRRSIAVLAALRQWQTRDAAGLAMPIDTLGETKTAALAALARKPLRLIGWHLQIGTSAGGQLDARQGGETKMRLAAN